MSRLLVGLLTLWLVFSETSGFTQEDDRDLLGRYRKEQMGISIPSNLRWFNSKRKLNNIDIANRFFIVHRWEPGDIYNDESMFEMNRLQSSYDNLVVLTVIERDSSFSDQQVGELIERYRINHPVAVGTELQTLGFDSDATPAVVMSLKDDGKLGPVSGKGTAPSIVDAVTKILKESSISINLDQTRFSAFMPSSSLTGVYTHPFTLEGSDREQRFFVADALKHRVVMTDVTGLVSETIGTGVNGFRDGSFGTCQLSYPTGLAIDAENRVLYISEPFNHTVRAVDLRTGAVKTILGNGKQGEVQTAYVDSVSGALSYPSDLAFSGGRLFIAMSGWNQIWEYDAQSKRARVFAGTGLEVTSDGSVGECSFGVPEKITADSKGNLYVYDSKTKSLRFISENKTVTLADGLTPIASGVVGFPELADMTCDGTILYVTDSQLNRIFKYDGSKWSILSGAGEKGHINKKGKKAKYNRPGGLDVVNGQLLVVDRGNECVREVSLKNGRAATMALRNVDILFRNTEAYVEGDRVYLDPVAIGPGTNDIYIELDLGSEYTVLKDGRNEAFIEANNFNRLTNGNPARGFLEVSCEQSEMNPYIDIQVYITVTEKTTGTVLFRPVLLVIPLEFNETVGKSHDVRWKALAR